MRGITLIGMPGSGKSTIGKLLAERLDFRFIDLDDLIKEKTGRSHAEILEKDGPDALINLENQLTLELNFSCAFHSHGRVRIDEGQRPEARCSHAVFAPGGSIIYSLPAMEKLRRETTVIYLDLPLEEIRRRLGKNMDSRGIVGLASQGIAGLFSERVPLYQKFAHHVIPCINLSDQNIIDKICNVILL